jgi:hypothetical protein
VICSACIFDEGFNKIAELLKFYVRGWSPRLSINLEGVYLMKDLSLREFGLKVMSMKYSDFSRWNSVAAFQPEVLSCVEKNRARHFALSDAWVMVILYAIDFFAHA